MNSIGDLKLRRLLLGLVSTLVVACSRAGSISNPSSTDFNGAKVEITAQGGIAAFATRQAVSHDDHAYVVTRRHICDKDCGAPLDSASGAFSAAATDSLFSIVLGEGPFSLKDDYGITVGGADMMSYVVTITASGKVKAIHADDGTMPEPLRGIVQAVMGFIAAPRR